MTRTHALGWAKIGSPGDVWCGLTKVDIHSLGEELTTSWHSVTCVECRNASPEETKAAQGWIAAMANDGPEEWE